MTTPRSQGPDFWRQHAEDCARSGLSLTAYAQQQGLPMSTFCRWQRKLAAKVAPSIIPLQVMPGADPAARLDAALCLTRDDWRLQLPASVSAAWLAELLRGLS